MTHHRHLRHKEALARIAASLTPLEPISLPLEGAHRRAASKEIRADRDIPDVDRSLMDGFAFSSGDTAGATSGTPIRLAVQDIIHSSTARPKPIQSGQAARILTGGKIPAGADTVIRQEDTPLSNDTIHVQDPVKPGRHIVRRGSHIAEGDVVVRTGEILTPGIVQTLAALRIRETEVTPIPRIGLVAVGNELTDLKCGGRDEGKQVASNLYMLSAMVSESGGAVESMAVCGDDTEAIQNAVLKALHADVVITTGGSAGSPSDLTRAALETLGVRLSVAGLAMNPGKSAGFGLYDGKPVFILPGPPNAVFTLFYALVRPALGYLTGRETDHIKTVSARLDQAIERRPGREHWLQGRVYGNPGRLKVSPLSRSESKRFAAMIQANGFILIDARHTSLREGASVPVHLLPGRAYTLSGPHPPVISIVGRSNAGKTTLLEQLVKTLVARGYRVGTIKHNPHGFEIDREGKDTWRHKQAGALTVAISSPQKVAVIRDLPAEETPSDLVSTYFSDLDLVLAEGYKALNGPKIEVFRSTLHDTPLCRKDPGLVAFVSDVPLGPDTPSFGLEDIAGVADLVEKTYLINS